MGEVRVLKGRVHFYGDILQELQREIESVLRMSLARCVVSFWAMIAAEYKGAYLWAKIVRDDESCKGHHAECEAALAPTRRTSTRTAVTRGKK
jgi:hypothetical protein